METKLAICCIVIILFTSCLYGNRAHQVHQETQAQMVTQDHLYVTDDVMMTSLIAMFRATQEFEELKETKGQLDQR